MKEIQKTFADGNLIIMTQDLGIKNGEYNYEISIDKKELLKLQKTITQIQTGTGMTDAEMVIAQKTLDASSFSGTLTVNQSNKEFGAMILNYSIASAAPISGTVIADKTVN